MSHVTRTDLSAQPPLLDLPPAEARERLSAWVAERGLPGYRVG